jgi:hypothetical protein
LCVLLSLLLYIALCLLSVLEIIGTYLCAAAGCKQKKLPAPPENNTHAMQFVYWFYSQPAALTFAVWPERDFGRASASWRALLVLGASVHSKKKKHRTNNSFFFTRCQQLHLFFCPIRSLRENVSCLSQSSSALCLINK